MPYGEGMSLLLQIEADLKQAMLARDAGKLAVLRMLKSAVKNAQIEAGGPAVELDDAAVSAVVRKELKKRQESIESFEGAGRADLAEKEKEEAAVLEAYLPKPLSAEEAEALVRAAIAETGATGKAQMGAVMKAATRMAEGRLDGRTLSGLVQKALG